MKCWVHGLPHTSSKKHLHWSIFHMGLYEHQCLKNSDVCFFDWQHWGPIPYCWTSRSTGTHIVANLRFNKGKISHKHFLRIGWKESLQQHPIFCSQPMVSRKRSLQPIHWHLEIADQHQQLQSAAARQDFFVSLLSHLCNGVVSSLRSGHAMVGACHNISTSQF